MPEASGNSPNSNKKARLGRGLGSLLGGTPDLSSDAPTPPTPKKETAQTAAPPKPASSPVVNQTVKPTTTPSAVVAPAPTTTQPLASQTPAVTSPLASQPTPVATQPAPSKINEEAQIWQIPIDRLVPNTQQPRQTFTADALRDLTASIKEQGILQPITARRLGERKFEIIAGERRWRAAQAAGLHEVPVILRNVTEQVSLELAIIENIQRENLNPMEEAEAVEHLMVTYKMTQQLVAEKLGKDRSSVANSLRLLTLPKELREMVRTTELSAGHAKVLLGADNPQTMLNIAKKVINDKLSVRATEKLVAQAKADARAKDDPDGTNQTKVPHRLIEGLSSELQKLIGTKVGIDYAQGKGRLTVHFYTDDQLTSIVEKLRRSWQK